MTEQQILPGDLSLAGQYAEPDAPRAEESLSLTVALPGLLVWVGVGLIAAILGFFGQVFAAGVLVVLTFFIHAVVNPRVSVYGYMFIVPMEWTVVFITGGFGICKVVGVVVLLVSLPKLVRSFGAGRWDPCAKWVAVLLLWPLVGVMWSIVPLATILAWQTLVLVWGMLWLIPLHLDTPRALKCGLLFMVAGALVSALLYLTVIDARAVLGSQWERPVQTALVGGGGGALEVSENSNTLARVYCIATIVSLFMVFKNRGIVRRLPFVGMLLVFGMSIILLKGRATYLALPMAIVAGVLLFKGGKITGRILLIGLLTIVAGGTFYVLARFGFLGEVIQQRFATIFDPTASARTGRLVMWMAHARAFLNTGFVGHALGTMTYTPESLYHVAHNDYFAILGELGIIGIVAFGAFHIGLFRRMRKVSDRWESYFCVTAWAMVLLGAVTQNDFMAKYYTWTLGTLLAVVRIDEARRADAAPELLAASE